MIPRSGRPGGGRVAVDVLQSALLTGNPLFDPATRELPVYLPPSYDTGSTTYPVLYCLSGFTGAARSWFNFQAWVPSMDERLDRLFASGMPEMIVVFPDCFTRYGGSQYLDSPATGRYRSWLLQEVVQHVDGRYRTRPECRYRAVMGKSSGGFGALSLAMDHPEMFSAVACHSGDMYFEYSYLPDFPVAARGLEKAGGLAKFLDGIGSAPLSGKEDHAVINVVAMSACYSPNPDSKPHLFDLPFHERTGELIRDVWNRWLEKDPVVRARSGNHRLREMNRIFLDCGRRDEFYLNLGARIFVQELAKSGIPCVYEEFDGGHSNVQFRYDISLRLLADYLNGS